METIFDIIDFLIDKPGTLLMALAVSLALGGVVLAAQWLSARSDVRRRTVRLAAETAGGGHNAEMPDSSAKRKAAIAQLTGSLDRLFGEGNEAASKILRKQLIQAGYYSPSAPGIFLGVRLLAMLAFGAVGFGAGIAADDHMTTVYMKLVGGASLGYFLPPIVLDRITTKRRDEHRAGFPDFLDLMIVCAEAGLSMEASINRVCRDMADAYPSLSANLYLATLEIRAGRTVNDALNNLADRLGIEEAKTFATLLQQSAELGSSLIDSLKIYSDDMRNKRMMRAEEKANSLPSKMVVPMMIFIFPILFIILLFPAYMRVMANWTM
jgi:tight adherence protein C